MEGQDIYKGRVPTLEPKTLADSSTLATFTIGIYSLFSKLFLRPKIVSNHMTIQLKYSIFSLRISESLAKSKWDTSIPFPPFPRIVKPVMNSSSFAQFRIDERAYISR